MTEIEVMDKLKTNAKQYVEIILRHHQSPRPDGGLSQAGWVGSTIRVCVVCAVAHW